MLLSCVATLAVALAGFPTAPAPDGVDLLPVLTSTPFGAVGGQAVTHTIVLSGTGTGSVPGVRVTFTTTVALDGVAARPSQGRCAVVDDRTVVCELGVVTVPTVDTAPTVTITGTLASRPAGGTLVQNLVTLTSQAPDADGSDDTASNAYLLPGPSGKPAVPGGARSPGATGHGPGYRVPVAAGVFGCSVLAGILLVRRRRRRDVTDRAPGAM